MAAGLCWQLLPESGEGDYPQITKAPQYQVGGSRTPSGAFVLGFTKAPQYHKFWCFNEKLPMIFHCWWWHFSFENVYCDSQYTTQTHMWPAQIYMAAVGSCCMQCTTQGVVWNVCITLYIAVHCIQHTLQTTVHCICMQCMHYTLYCSCCMQCMHYTLHCSALHTTAANISRVYYTGNICVCEQTVVCNVCNTLLTHVVCNTLRNLLAAVVCYGVATITRLLKIIGLFCRISSLLLGSFSKKNYHFKEPTNRSHPICNTYCIWGGYD